MVWPRLGARKVFSARSAHPNHFVPSILSMSLTRLNENVGRASQEETVVHRFKGMMAFVMSVICGLQAAVPCRCEFFGRAICSASCDARSHNAGCGCSTQPPAKQGCCRSQHKLLTASHQPDSAPQTPGKHCPFCTKSGWMICPRVVDRALPIDQWSCAIECQSESGDVHLDCASTLHLVAIVSTKLGRLRRPSRLQV